VASWGEKGTNTSVKPSAAHESSTSRGLRQTIAEDSGGTGEGQRKEGDLADLPGKRVGKNRKNILMEGSYRVADNGKHDR